MEQSNRPWLQILKSIKVDNQQKPLNGMAAMSSRFLWSKSRWRTYIEPQKRITASPSTRKREGRVKGQVKDIHYRANFSFMSQVQKLYCIANAFLLAAKKGLPPGYPGSSLGIYGEIFSSNRLNNCRHEIHEKSLLSYL